MEVVSQIDISALVQDAHTPVWSPTSDADAEMTALLNIHPDNITSLKDIQVAFEKLCEEEVKI